jgi:hypothetical protein
MIIFEVLKGDTLNIIIDLFAGTGGFWYDSFFIEVLFCAAWHYNQHIMK